MADPTDDVSNVVADTDSTSLLPSVSSSLPDRDDEKSSPVARATPAPTPPPPSPSPSLSQGNGGGPKAWLAGLEHWREVGLDNLRTTIDEEAVQIDRNSEQSLSSRKVLRDTIRQFKEKAPADQLKALGVGQVMKKFQEEIDSLTRRAKYSEDAYMRLYKCLIEAPDPTAVYQAIMTYGKKASLLQQKNTLIASELEKQQAKIKSYESELDSLKNQELTIRNLQDQIAKMEEDKKGILAQLDVRVAKQTEKAKAAFVEKEEAWKLRVEAAREQLVKEKQAHDATKSQIFELTQKLENVDEANESGNAMLLEDLERSNNLVRALQGEKEELRQRLQELEESPSAELASCQARQKELEVDLAHTRSILSSAHAQLQEKTDAWEVLQSKNAARMNDLEQQLQIVLREKGEMSKRLAQLPSTDEYQKLRRQLQLLQEVEFGADGDAEDSNGSPSTAGKTDAELSHRMESELTEAEKLLLRRSKRLEGKVTALKLEVSSLTSEKKELEERLQAKERDLEERSQLVHKLEEDLTQVHQHLHMQAAAAATATATSDSSSVAANSAGVPSAQSGETGMNAAGTGSDNIAVDMQRSASFDSASGEFSDDPSASVGAAAQAAALQTDHVARERAMFLAICSQRDRYRARVEEVEKAQQQKDEMLSKLNFELQQLQADNVKLYETLQYTRSFTSRTNNNMTGRRVTAAGGSLRNEREAGGVTRKDASSALSPTETDFDLEAAEALASEEEQKTHSSLVSGTPSKSSKVTESKYAKIYESKLNPFKEFTKQQQQVRYDQLSLQEKITLNVGRFVFSKKPFRSFMFYYAILLHVLVFITLYSHTWAPHCKQ